MDDLIRRTDAIRVASGYCHWSNIPDELAKLPSVNPKPCEDTISRKAAIDATTKYCVLYDLRELLEDIETLPSVSTEKTGRWEWNQYDYNPNLGNWHCSECGSIVIECVHKKDLSGVPLYKYCPQCGCRLMEVEE